MERIRTLNLSLALFPACSLYILIMTRSMNPGPPAGAGGKDTSAFNPHSRRQMLEGEMDSFAGTLTRSTTRFVGCEAIASENLLRKGRNLVQAQRRADPNFQPWKVLWQGPRRTFRPPPLHCLRSERSQVRQLHAHANHQRRPPPIYYAARRQSRAQVFYVSCPHPL
jgi:hypothetical protein